MSWSRFSADDNARREEHGFSKFAARWWSGAKGVVELASMDASPSNVSPTSRMQPVAYVERLLGITKTGVTIVEE